ncbi:tRNA pseudouridine(38-40) synthase TruA [Enterococcus hirae]|nr:tRNA pseudouridine(38-40) synthase TruA [Enterococcus hirae]
MTRYKAIIAYDGTLFSGFQSQPNARTVQAEIEKTLTRMNSNVPVKIYGSGRTDAGVHAKGQVIHFNFPAVSSLEKLRYGLDSQSPEDISCRSVKEVSADFNARYWVKSKTYEFRVDIGKPRNLFTRHYASFYPYPLDLVRIEEALPYFLGTHDFSGFCASHSSVRSKVRTVTKAEMVFDELEHQLIFTFSGNGFLYKMVRIMIGTLLKIGNGRMAPERILEILEKKDRNLAGPTASPEGLYLLEVEYADGPVKK